MNPIWLILLVVVAFLVLLRLKRRSKRRLKIPVYSRRIDGLQVVALLTPEMPSGCVFDHGVQFGHGFRRKHGPALPHGQGCGCTTVPFSFTSNEVFNGALRNFAEIRNTVDGLKQAEANQLLGALKRVESGPLPPTQKGYLALVEPDDFAGRTQQTVRDFCEKRFAFLASGAARAPHASEGDLATEN